MAFSEALAERIRQRLARRKNVEEKKMFGGIGFLLNGNLLVGVRNDSLLVRLGPEQSDEALPEAHRSESKITGRTMSGWVLVEPDGIEEDEQSKGWIQRAVNFVGMLPAKEKEPCPVCNLPSSRLCSPVTTPSGFLTRPP